MDLWEVNKAPEIHELIETSRYDLSREVSIVPSAYRHSYRPIGPTILRELQTFVKV